jgi:hypothetical protein
VVYKEICPENGRNCFRKIPLPFDHSYSANKHGTVFEILTFFFESHIFVVEMVLIAFLLFGIYGTVGYALTSFTTGVTSRTTAEGTTTSSKSKAKMEWNRTAAIEGLIAMAYVNNILVAVFAEQFFGIQTAVLPALYNIPYYIGIIVIKKLYSACKASYGLSETIGGY